MGGGGEKSCCKLKTHHRHFWKHDFHDRTGPQGVPYIKTWNGTVLWEDCTTVSTEFTISWFALTWLSCDDSAPISDSKLNIMKRHAVPDVIIWMVHSHKQVAT